MRRRPTFVQNPTLSSLLSLLGVFTPRTGDIPGIRVPHHCQKARVSLEHLGSTNHDSVINSRYISKLQ
jgi:hypothetical protein